MGLKDDERPLRGNLLVGLRPEPLRVSAIRRPSGAWGLGMTAPRKIRRWGLLWRSMNRLDGEKRHIICDNRLPALFCTRAEARAYREERFGYIRNRPELNTEPHGWKMPAVVRVAIALDAPPPTPGNNRS